MPNFKDIVQERDLPALKAYILDKAWHSYDEQQAKAPRAGH